MVLKNKVMSDKERQRLQHPEDDEIYFSVLRKRDGANDCKYWDTFQLVDNNDEESGRVLAAITKRGFDDPDKLPMIATQVITSTIEGVLTKIVLHVPVAVDKEKILKSENKKLSIGNCTTLFQGSHIH